jgi:hypothetical protein
MSEHRNFGKDIRNLTEDELFQHINRSNPEFGFLCQYELLRRLSLENSISSKRFATSSFYLSVVSILIALGIGAAQIYLQANQSIPFQ